MGREALITCQFNDDNERSEIEWKSLQEGLGRDPRWRSQPGSQRSPSYTRPNLVPALLAWGNAHQRHPEHGERSVGRKYERDDFRTQKSPPKRAFRAE